MLDPNKMLNPNQVKTTICVLSIQGLKPWTQIESHITLLALISFHSPTSPNSI